MPRNLRPLLIMLAILLFLVLMPPLPQDKSYHAFADQRTIFDISNFWDVISNLPFAIFGLMGLVKFRDFESRLLFFGVFSTAIGSSYYHLQPDNARLFWDRLPMTIVFMCLFALVLKRRTLVIPLVLAGIASVVWWKLADNLWPYALVQFGSMIVLVFLAARDRSQRGLGPALILYGLSKVTEFFDRQIYAVFPLSGHTLKHLLAGLATWYILLWMQSSTHDEPVVVLEPQSAN
jgi:hypothetical protein